MITFRTFLSFVCARAVFKRKFKSCISPFPRLLTRRLLVLIKTHS